MLMSQSLIVSSYFNLLRGVGEERGAGGREIGAVRGLGRDETRGKRDDDGPGKEERRQLRNGEGGES